MRQPDINRIARAQEHIKAAMTNLDSIKDENLEYLNRLDYNEIWKELLFCNQFLDTWVKALKEGRQ